jgi:hypothetical protein
MIDRPSLSMIATSDRPVAKRSRVMSGIDIETVRIDKPEELNVILGQAHFIKTVEDLYEALAGSSPHLRFGIAFCESSGPRLVRRVGNDEELIELFETRLRLEPGTRSSSSCERATR